VAHRPALLAAADVVATVRSEPLPDPVAAAPRGAQPDTVAPPPAGGGR